MADSVLARSARVQFLQGSSLNNTQIQVDGLVTRFTEEASSPITLGSLVVGSGMYRFARLGTMAAFEGRLAAPLVRGLSYGTGLFTEAASFQLTNRSLRIGFDGADSRSLQFGGSNGLATGTLESVITFGSLRGAGFLGREENIVFQHALQATTMVGGHQLTGHLGLTPAPEGTLAEQILHAEVTNLQLMAGMGLVHSLTGGRLEAAERSLDLSLHSRDSAGEGIRLPFLASLAPGHELAVAGGRGRASSHDDIADLFSRPALMTMKGEGESGATPAEGSRGSQSREPVQTDRVIDSLRQFVRRAREASEPKRERLPEEDFTELQRLAQHFRENPKELVETLTKIKEMVEQGDIEESVAQVLRELRNTKRSPERNATIAREALENMPLNRASFMSARHLLPNGLTIAAAVCAAVSVVEASEGRHEVAALLLPIAAVLDKLDGGVARATNASHPIGAGLDSYADFAAYGMASAFFTRAVLVSQGMPQMGNVLAGIIFSHALLRLAVFDFLGSNGHVLPTHDVLGNPISRDRSDFVGMPSTMVGLYAGLVYLAFGKNNPEAFALAMGAAGSAMFWPLRFVKFGNNFKNDADNPWRRAMTLLNVLGPTAVGGALAVAHENPQYLSYGLVAGAMSYVISPFLERATLAVSRWKNRGNPTDPSSTTTNAPNPNIRQPQEARAEEPSAQGSDRSAGDRLRVEAATGEGNDSEQGHPDGEQGEAQGFLDEEDLVEVKGPPPTPPIRDRPKK